LIQLIINANGAVTTHRRMRNAYATFIEIPDGNKTTWENKLEGEIILKWV
jgi:hypothetical protein